MKNNNKFSFLKMVVFINLLFKKQTNFMKKIKNVDNDLLWKLVWDNDTKDVLLLKQIKGEFETDRKSVV